LGSRVAGVCKEKEVGEGTRGVKGNFGAELEEEEEEEGVRMKERREERRKKKEEKKKKKKKEKERKKQKERRRKRRKENKRRKKKERKKERKKKERKRRIPERGCRVRREHIYGVMKQLCLEVQWQGGMIADGDEEDQTHRSLQHLVKEEERRK